MRERVSWNKGILRIFMDLEWLDVGVGFGIWKMDCSGLKERDLNNGFIRRKDKRIKVFIKMERIIFEGSWE